MGIHFSFCFLHFFFGYSQVIDYFLNDVAIESVQEDGSCDGIVEVRTNTTCLLCNNNVLTVNYSE